MNKTTILCHGDSSTWGWNPETTELFDPDERSSGVFAARLGDGHRVIEEGLNARSELSRAGAIETSKRFAPQYARVATAYGCEFFDAGSVVTTSGLDGIHREADGHRAFGEALAERLR